METHTLPIFDWAQDAFAALHDPKTAHVSDKWATISGSASANNQSFAVAPALLTNATVSRYGQVTPPEDRSPADERHCEREPSISIEQLQNEPLWPQQAQQQHSPPQHRIQEPSPKRRRTSRQAVVNPVFDAAQQQDTSANPQPLKRKRGRPKSQPLMIEAYTADGFPFQVSSARQSHLEKNRVAAHKCRQRKKEYIGGLEGRAREFSNKNKQLKANVAMLREEVLSLKNEVLRHAGCGFWAVDEYLARCAGDLLGMDAPQSSQRPSSLQHNHQMHDSSIGSMETTDQFASHHRLDSVTSRETMSSPGSDDFGGLELLKDYEDDMKEQR